MTGSSDPNDQGPEPQIDQERAFLAAYRERDEADRVLLWSELLAELDRGWPQAPDEESGS